MKSMKKLNWIYGFIMISAMALTVHVFAQSTATPTALPTILPATEVVLVGTQINPPSPEEVKALIAAFGGLKGASTMVIIAFAVQALMLLFRSKIGTFAGKYRLLIVMFLTLGGGIVSLKFQGLDWISVLFNSTTLAAFQVFFHQIVSQFFPKKEEVSRPA